MGVLAFAEFMQIRADGDAYCAWADYVEHGGLPLQATMIEARERAGQERGEAQLGHRLHVCAQVYIA